MMHSYVLAIERELCISNQYISQQILSVVSSEARVSGANKSTNSHHLQVFKVKSQTALTGEAIKDTVSRLSRLIHAVS